MSFLEEAAPSERRRVERPPPVRFGEGAQTEHEKPGKGAKAGPNQGCSSTSARVKDAAGDCETEPHPKSPQKSWHIPKFNNRFPYHSMLRPETEACFMVFFMGECLSYRVLAVTATRNRTPTAREIPHKAPVETVRVLPCVYHLANHDNVIDLQARRAAPPRLNARVEGTTL